MSDDNVRVILDDYDAAANRNRTLDFKDVVWDTVNGALEIIRMPDCTTIAEFAAGKWIAVYGVDAVHAPEAKTFSIVPQPQV